MSKISLRSKPSRPRLTARRRRMIEENQHLKPFGFCCSVDNFDPLSKYNNVGPHLESSLLSIRSVNESPVLKFHTNVEDKPILERKKRPARTRIAGIGDHRKSRDIQNARNPRDASASRNAGNPRDASASRNPRNPRTAGYSPNRRNAGGGGPYDETDTQEYSGRFALSEPIKWYIEDEIALARNILCEKRKETYVKETQKNTNIGRRKTKMRINRLANIKCPRWFQDFSFEQIENLMILDSVIQKDYEEMVTGRTQRTLTAIGVTSTFFKIAPKDIRKIQESSERNVPNFLREVYKILTGSYFEEEEYKKSYDCNERIILSAIAFLTLPEAVMELHERLPPVIIPKIPPKPTPPTLTPRQRNISPYKEDLFSKPDWSVYYNDLQLWRQNRRLLPIPKLILPPEICIIRTITTTVFVNHDDNKQRSSLRTSFGSNVPRGGKSETTVGPRLKGGKETPSKTKSGRISKLFESPRSSAFDEDKLNRRSFDKSMVFDIPRLPDEKKVFDFTLNGISERSGPVEYKICGTLKPPKPIKKSWLGEKDAHFVVTGAADDPPTCPITYELSGVANVTPTNSDERFFAVLKLPDGEKKVYPKGRQNLSRNWQDWLQNADEEFKKVEAEANKMIKSIEATMRLVFPGPTCDSCCSCRQTRKTHIKLRQTKAPYFVIDSLAEDDNKQRYIVGSMAMHSPAPTPPESSMNLIEVIASKDVLQSNVVINGITNDKGETQYYISGFRKDTIRIPARVIHPPPPRPLRNVPPCVCAVHEIFNKGLLPTLSKDNIPWTKDEGQCFGKKYRPAESPAYSCKASPGDKSCRRNPFMPEIARMKRSMERKLQEEKDKMVKGDKKMYTIADFQPCGDEHGMAVCGGPWGAVHTLTPEELEKLEKERKEILRGPPCGTRPGRAVCEGPFGERVPEVEKPHVVLEDEMMGEDEELDEEEDLTDEEQEKPPVVEEKQKPKIRGEGCYMSPEAIQGRKKVVVKKVGKFIPDPNYHGYDDLWNIFRTAPSVKDTDFQYKDTLKLSTPVPRTTATKLGRKPKETARQTAASGRQHAFSSFKRKEPGRFSRRERRRTTSLKRTASGRSSTRRFSSKTRTSGKRSSRKSSSPSSRRRTSSGRRSVGRSSSLPTRGRSKKRSSIRRPKSTARMSVGKLYRQASKPLKPPARSRSTSRKMSGRGKPDRRGTSRKPSKRFSFRKRAPSKQPSSHRSKTFKHTGKRPSLKRVESKSSRHRIKKSSTDVRRDAGSVHKGLRKPAHSRRSTNIQKKTGMGFDRSRDKGMTKRKGKSSMSVASRARSRSRSLSRRRSTKHDRRKDSQAVSFIDPAQHRQQEIDRLKTMMMSSDNYPHDVEPVVLPDEQRLPCKHEYEEKDESIASEEHEEDSTQLTCRGPCGWKTKSEQELPVKKTLVYLAEPDYPPVTVPLRPGGRACVCRENRDKKKVLLYNIGGLIGGRKEETQEQLLKKKKEDIEEKKTHVIDGVLYFTPPPSPRRSDEYVPEYDLYESRYDMCHNNRKDENIKLLEQHAGPKSLVNAAKKVVEPCGCNEYIDTYGLQETDEMKERKRMEKEAEKTQRDLFEAKSPKERWKLALKDVGLLDYFARCRDCLPCWLKCSKFNKQGCSFRRPKLQVKRPVCECKYERNVLEYREEKMKAKERRYRLKSLKKQPYMKVVNTMRAIEPDTKLMISGVKRLPRDDEYIDDIKYCITGVAENYTMLPPQQVVGGIQMATPVFTPEPSEHEIPCKCLHRHWSPIHGPAGPLPRKDEAIIAEKKRREQAVQDALQEIYKPPEVYDTHVHGCQETCNSQSSKDPKESRDSKEDGNNRMVQSVRSTADYRVGRKSGGSRKGKKRSKPGRKIEESNVKWNRNTKVKGNASSRISGGSENTSRIFGGSQNPSRIFRGSEKTSKTALPSPDTTYRKYLQKQKSTTFDNTIRKGGKDDNENPDDAVPTDLMTMAKTELEKMAGEGYLFAKLPKCFSVPQLQYWLMYRKGIMLTDADRHNSVRNTVAMWNIMTAEGPPKTPAPELDLTESQRHNLTFNDAEKTKAQIAKKKAIYYSRVRKERVWYTRAMWNTMEYGTFPSRSFKRAYFTYMAGKEADGHVYKPWFPSEVRDMI